MTLPFVCVFLAFLITYISKIPLARAMAQEPGGYDNRFPRDQQAQLTGWGRRALAAHQNHFEAFPYFAAAVIIAHLTQANPKWCSILALSFVSTRILYNIFYIANWDKLRSTVWLLGWGATLGLFLLSWN